MIGDKNISVWRINPTYKQVMSIQNELGEVPKSGITLAGQVLEIRYSTTQECALQGGRVTEPK